MKAICKKLETETEIRLERNIRSHMRLNRLPFTSPANFILSFYKYSHLTLWKTLYKTCYTPSHNSILHFGRHCFDIWNGKPKTDEKYFMTNIDLNAKMVISFDPFRLYFTFSHLISVCSLIFVVLLSLSKWGKPKKKKKNYSH